MFNFTPNFDVRAEYEFFQIDIGDAALISIGAVWRF